MKYKGKYLETQIMNTDIYKLYIALLKKHGKVTGFRQVMDGLFAIEYWYLHPVGHDMVGRFWLGDISQLFKYLENLESIEEEKYSWVGDEMMKRLVSEMDNVCPTT